jgi:hypothetical protein
VLKHGRWYNLPKQKQRGGTVTLSQWLALLLLALCVGEAATINYLYQHRTVRFVVGTNKPVSDDYTMHAFPADRTVCTYTNTICWIRI